ncbi:MAG: hypothetical protein IJ814_04750 [Paludibacteraceae bacterium]|nr:hypothetical protein [Paludibacteraceae bacterium]
MDWTKQIGRYIVVMFLQVLLFNRLQLAGVCHPYVYILCLLMMPATLPHSVDLLLGAVAGLIMDVFCNSLGIHMAACTLIMLLRPFMLGQMVNDIERLNAEISTHTLGIDAMAKYTSLLVVIHHMTVFLLASWSWTHIGFALVETAVSSLVSIALILGYNFVKYR